MTVIDRTDWKLSVVQEGHEVFSCPLPRTLIIGRQNKGEPAPVCLHSTGETPRLIIAGGLENTISRSHVRLDRQSDGRVRIRSLKFGCSVQPWGDLEADGVCETHGNAVLRIGHVDIRLAHPTAAYGSLQEAALPPGQETETCTRFVTRFPSLLPEANVNANANQTQLLLRWIHGTADVFHDSAASPEFFQKVAKTAMEIAELNVASVELFRDGQWETAALYPPLEEMPDKSWKASTTVLSRVVAEKKTIWRVRGSDISDTDATTNIKNLSAVVAAPILDEEGVVIGAVYGDRRQLSRGTSVAEIKELEARFIELLACGVQAGLARLKQERHGALFEQFFTPELANRLVANEALLKGKKAEVTILVCDIRGFSRISEQIGPEQTVEWINDVLGRLSECVLHHRGVLVDYTGDELMAMWGAPEASNTHASDACRTAAEMLGQLPGLDDHWKDIVGEPTQIGIGVNSGPVFVGNVGSGHKFKYGPHGKTVNLASRVQGVTKHLGVPLLVTESTAQQLDEEFVTRRVCQVRVLNMAHPVALFDYQPASDDSWLDLKRDYEMALDHFENRSFGPATEALGGILARHLDDGPTRALLARSLVAMSKGAEDEHPTWELEEK